MSNSIAIAVLHFVGKERRKTFDINTTAEMPADKNIEARTTSKLAQK